jgi:hypothetical protein
MQYDEEVRNYFFDVMLNLNNRSKSEVLVSMYGWLEGFAHENPEPLERMMTLIQMHAD